VYKGLLPRSMIKTEPVRKNWTVTYVVALLYANDSIGKESREP